MVATNLTNNSEVAERMLSLSRPEGDNCQYSRSNWFDILSSLSAKEALSIRENTTDSFIRNVLGGLVTIRTNNKKHLDKALDIRRYNETSTNRVQNRILSTLNYLPIVTGCLLCGWVNHIDVYDKSYYKENIRDSVGYYHPTEHYIEVASDFSDPCDNWARNLEYDSKPTYSTTIHELGHAVHYMNGVRINNPDTLDNSSKDNIELDLKKGIVRSDWQESFLWEGIEGYYDIFNGRYDHLRVLSKYQELTLEEYFAIAFEAWITHPKYLYRKQPIVWRTFKRLR